MMMVIKRKRKQAARGQNVHPARLGLAVLALVCIGVAYWDINYNSSLPENGAQSAVVAVSAKGRSTQAETEEAQAVEAVGAEPAEEAAPADALFASYRLEREKSREEELALLEEIVSDPQVSETARAEAEARRQQVAETVEREATAESLLAARGCGETVVLVSGERATVVCRTELDRERAAQMAQVVAETCGISFENVVIVNQ